jgi:hypothetical protein
MVLKAIFTDFLYSQFTTTFNLFDTIGGMPLLAMHRYAPA